jgi:peroxiredoxin
MADKFGSIYVTSDPAGAAILIDQALTSKITPDTLLGVSVGDHVISVMRTGYLSSPDSVVISVGENQISSAEFVLLETAYGSLKVTSNIDGSTICIDNQPSSQNTPYVFFNSIPVGIHIVSIFKEGYSNDNPTKEVVEIVTRDTAEVHFDLSLAEVDTSLGDITPDFNLQDDFGFWHRLYAYRGFVILINFWAEECYYCMQELPHLQDIYTEYRADSLIMFGVNYNDDFGVIGRIRDEKQLEFTLLKALGTDVKDEFQVTSTPVTIILDREGKIRLWWKSFQHPSIANKFRDKLDELFGR